MHLHDILPQFDKREIHEIEIRASKEAVFDAVWNMDLKKSWVVRTLMALRGMPPRALTTKGLIELGFNVLVDDPPQELVLGIAAQFWTSRPEPHALDADSFRAFAEPGGSKAAWNFYLTQIDNGRVRLSTETRVFSSDAKSKRKFAFYWMLIRPFSGWIRRKMLAIIKSEAEQPA